MSKILLNTGLIMEHSKTKLFHFTRARYPPNPSIDLSSVGGPVISPKPILCYLGLYFDRKLNFYFHTHFYATKCLSTLNAMKMLGNSSCGLLPIQKCLLYRTCVLPITLYGFQLWFFKGAPHVKNISELKKMQWRAALWITGAFRTSPSEGIEAIAGLIPITMHLCKLNGRHHLWYASIPPSHAINSLLDSQHTKGQLPHRVATSKLTTKQQANLKSPIKDTNKHLNGIRNCFNPLHPLFSPGSRIVDHFSSRISFHSSPSSSNEDLHHHLQNLDHAFKASQTSSYNIAVIADGGVRKSHVAIAAAHIWCDNSVIQCLQVHSINVTSIEAELMAIRTGLISAMEKDNIHDIIVITDSITMAKKILESRVDPLQNIVIPIASAIKTYLKKDGRNKIHFWYYPSRAKWPRHQLVNDQVKASECVPVFPCKESYLFSKKKECDNILYEWQESFANSLKKGQCFLDFEDEKQQVIKPTYTKGGSWLPFIGFKNSLCTRFTCMTTGHAPIGEYRQRFFPHLPTSYLCGKVEVQTREHIIMECDLHDPSTRPCNIIINSFVHFLTDNPGAFSFDNRWGSTVVWPLGVKAQHLSPQFLLVTSFLLSTISLFFISSYLSRYYVLTTVCLRALCNKLLK